MMGPGCLRVGPLLPRSSAALTESDRLLLEEHVATCERCRSERRMLVAMRAMVDEAPLRGGPIDRVIVRALSRESVPVQTARTPVLRSPWMVAVAGLMAIIAIGIAVVISRPTRPRALEATPATPRHSPAPPLRIPAPETPPDRIQLGTLLAADGVLGSGAQVPAGVELRASEDVRVQVANADVLLRAGTRVEWSSTTATLLLAEGAVSVGVHPQAGTRFRVATASFVIEVLGTRFDVDLTGVDVEEGTVRVLTPDGSPLVEVPAGDRWRVSSPATPTPVAGGKVARAPIASRSEVAERIAAARRALAKGDSGVARRELGLLLQRPLRRTDEAEARTLLAETAVSAGDPGGAVRLYLDVVRRFPGLAAAENALFAAARVEIRRGDRDAARRLLERYLARYPRGRFREDATARLRSLAGDQ